MLPHISVTVQLMHYSYIITAYYVSVVEKWVVLYFDCFDMSFYHATLPLSLFK